MLQLEDDQLEAPRWFSRAKSAAFKYYPNPYYQAARYAWKRRPSFLREELSQPYAEIVESIKGTPTYYQFLSEEGLSGEESALEQGSRFGRWIKTKALPKLQTLQKSLSPVIGLLPGGGAVNAAFDIINRPKDGSLPAPEMQVVPAPASISPAPIYSTPAPLSPYSGAMPQNAFFTTDAGTQGDNWFTRNRGFIFAGALATIVALTLYKALKK